MTDILAAQLAAPAAYVRDRLASTTSALEGTPPAQSLDPDQAAVLQKALEAVREWRQSPEGAAFLGSLKQCGAEEIRAELDALMQGPRFDEVRKFSLGLNLLPKAISIGFAGQIELFIGLYGSIGYIADIDLSGGDRGLYLLGAAAEGIDASADLAIQVGLWMESVSDVSGSYKGAELGVDDVFGLSGFTLTKDDDVKAVLVDLDGGISDGASALEFYMKTFAGSSNPVAQKPKRYMLILDQLTCLKASEDGHDEVYLTFSIDGDTNTVYRYPTWSYYAMKPGDTDARWDLGRSVWCDTKADITLYDLDNSDVPFDDDDIIGKITIRVTDFAGVGSSHAKTYNGSGSGGSYQLKAYLLADTAT